MVTQYLKIETLGTTNVDTIDTNSLGGDDRNGIAVSNTHVFLTGDSQTTVTDEDLNTVAVTGVLYDGIVSDVASGQVYTFATSAGTPFFGFSGSFTHLILLDGTTGAQTGNSIALDMSIQVGSGSGVFAGAGRVVIYSNSVGHIYDIDLSNGDVTDLGAFARPSMFQSENWASWGVAEYFDGELHLAYRDNDSQTIERLTLSTLATETIASFTSLGDLASFTISPDEQRWYFHYESSSGQFGGGAEPLFFADAVINFTTVNDAPIVSGPVMGTATEDGALVTLGALANATDIDSASLTIVDVPGTLPNGVTFAATSDIPLANYLGISVPVNSHDANSFAKDSGIWSVTAPFSVTSGIANLINPAPATPGAFSIHDHIYVPPGSFVPDPTRAVITFEFATPTVIDAVDIVEHANGITKLRGFVGNSLNDMTDIGVVTGTLGDITGSFIVPEFTVNTFDFNNTQAGTFFQVVLEKASFNAGYALYRLTPEQLANAFTLDPSHASYQYLGENEQTVVTVNYGVSDGFEITPASVSWTVFGVNDAASITIVGLQDVSATEAGAASPGDPTAGGQLTVSDVDQGQAKFEAPGSLAGTYGSFTFDADTGVWGYTLDQGKADKLAGGTSDTDMLTVKSYDGTASYDITVNIDGANDAPVLTSPDLAAFYRFDEASGSTVVDEAGTHNGSIVGAIRVAGVSGNALSFNGTSDYVSIPDSPDWDFGSDDFSISLWANFSAVPAVNFGDILIAHDNGVGSVPKWFIGVGGGNLAFHTNDVGGGSGFQGNAAFTPTTGQWYNITLSKSGTAYQFFVNGELAGSFTGPATIPNASAALTIGQGENLAFFAGQIDGVGVFHRALTQTEAAYIYDNGVAVPPTAAVLAAIAEDSGTRLITQAELLVNVSDVDGPTLTASKLSIESGQGSLTDNNNGTWTYQPQSNDSSAVAFSYEVSDGVAPAIAASAVMDITPVNDAPVVAIASATYSATEQQLLNLKNSGISISDPDAGNAAVTVTMSVGEGALNISAGGSGASVTNSGTSSVTISGTIAQINALLGTDPTSTVEYLNSHAIPSATTTMTVAVNDNGNSGGGAEVSSNNAIINITPVNNAPTFFIADPAWSYAEQGPELLLAPNSSLTDSELDGIGNGNYAGAQLEVRRSSGADLSDVFSFTAMTNVSYVGSELQLGGLTIGIVSNSGGEMIVTFTDAYGAVPGTGIVNEIFEGITYANTSDNPPSSIELQFSLNDGDSLDPQIGIATVSINVTPVNDAPGAVNDTLAATEDTAVTFTKAQLLGNDTDVDNTNAQLSIASVTSGVGGSAVLNVDGTVTFTPTANFNGPASFTYKTKDGTDTSANSATVTVNVASVNDAPVLDLDSGASGTGVTLNYIENQAPTIIAPAVAVSDVDSANFDGGLLNIGFATNGTTSDQITILHEGTGPGQIGVSGNTVTYEGTTIGTINANGGVNGAGLVIFLAGAAATQTAVHALIGRIAYSNTSDNPSTAPRSLVVVLVDGDGNANGGADTAIVTATINVAAANDTATIAPDGVQDASVTEAGGTGNASPGDPTAGGQLKVSDADTGEDHFQTPGALAGTYGTFTFNSTTGAWGYTLDQAKADQLTAGQPVTDTLTVKSFDGTASFDIVVDITGANDHATISELGATSTGLDIVIGNYHGGSNGAIVSLNDGNGTFGAGTPVATGGSTHYAVALGDVNGDGQLDIVAQTDSGGGTAHVGLGKGDGTFVAGPSVTTGGSPATDVTLGDVNGDGKLDIVTTAYYYGANISLGNGDGTFASGTTVGIGGTGAYLFYGVALGDLNGDAKLDIVASGYWGAGYTLNNGNGTFAPSTNLVTNGGIHNADVALGDVNGDGTLDIVTADRPAGADVILNNGDGTFAAGVQVAMPGSEHYAVALGDVNGDGKLDIVTAHSGGASISLNLGGGTFAAGTLIPTGGGANYALALGDVNGDGKLDIVTSAYHDGVNGARVGLGNGDGTFSAFTAVATGGAEHYFNSLALGDLDPVLVIADTKVTEAGGIANATLGDPSASGQLAVTDVDTGEAKFAALASLDGTYGTFSFDTDTGEWSYALDQGKADKIAGGASETDTLTVTSFDGTDSYDILVNIAGANDVPVAVNDTLAATEDAAVNLDVLDNDTDADGDLLIVSSLPSLSTYGATLTVSGSLIIYDPTAAIDIQALNDGQTLTDTFTYTISDGNGGFDTATVTIEVAGINDNDPPSAVDDDGLAIEAGVVAGTDATGNVLDNDTDPDAGDTKSVTTTGSFTGQYGTLTLQTDGSFTYSPDDGNATVNALRLYTDTLTDTFSYTMQDAAGETSTADIVITIHGANDAPTVANVIANQSATEDSAFSFQFAANTIADVDAGDTLTYTAQLAGGGALPSWLSFNAATRTISGTPGNDDVGTISIDVTAEDSNGASATDTFDIVIANTNDAPTVANVIANQSATEDSAFSFQFAANTFADVDAGDTLTYMAQLAGGGALPSWLTFNAATRTFSGTPENDDVGTISIDVKADDGNGGTVTDTFDIVIANTNDPASITGTKTGNVKEDTAGQLSTGGTLTVHDVDADEDVFRAAVGLIGLYGTFAFNEVTGVWSYGLDHLKADSLYDGEIVKDTLTVTSYDGTATETITVTITGTNDAPDAVNDTGLITAHATDLVVTQLALLDNDSDVDGDTITIASVQAASNGAVKLDGANVVFTPDVGTVGPASFEYTVSDGKGGSSTATVSLTIAGNVINGTAGADKLNGTADADIIDAGKGSDTVKAGDGNDLIIAKSGDGNDVYDGGDGIDTLDMSSTTAGATIRLNLPATSSGFGSSSTQTGGDILISIENVLAGSGADKITGSDVANHLDGGAGNDKLYGLGGDDTLIGGAGKDTLDGGAGADKMSGGAGADIYFVDNLGDAVTETTVSTATAEHDLVNSSVDFTLGVNVENLTLTGTAAISGTGNQGANTIVGNSAANTLDGGIDAGAVIDQLKGGLGSDTYIVRDVRDAITESANQGSDTVVSQIDYTLGSNVENLTLAEAGGSTSGTGNTLVNVINGNSYTNVLNGKAGNDTLTGGLGADTFVFNTALNAKTNVDLILDFEAGVDHIALARSIFTTIGPVGDLAFEAFHTGLAAHDASDRIIYNSLNGDVFYDRDGTGSGAQVKFASLTAGLSLTEGDFIVV